MRSADFARTAAPPASSPSHPEPHDAAASTDSSTSSWMRRGRDVDRHDVARLDQPDRAAPLGSSGETCPIEQPELPLEKRLSVMSAQLFASPFDFR